MIPGARAFLGLALLAAATGCGGPGDAPPSILLLSIDTMRRDHLPFYGYGRDTAPRWNAALARRGVVFDGAIAVNTNTAPSHASMLSGLYPAQHGILDNGFALVDGVRLLPELLRPRGYRSAAFVSAATLAPGTGLARAFDLYRPTYPPKPFPATTADVTVAAARAWLAERAGEARPFFLFVHLYDPHFPYGPHPELEREFLGEAASAPLPRQRELAFPNEGWTPRVAERLVARYDAEIRFADEQSGLLLDDLERLRLARRTIVVLVSDHGETLFERPWVCDHGARVYDEQVRVPLVLRFPDGRAAGRRVASPVSHVDLLPTLLESAGVAPPGGLPGRSLLPLLEGESEGDRARPLFSSARAVAERVPELGREIRRGFVHSVRWRDRKLIRYPGPRGPVWQLFDLARDPAERVDLSARPGSGLGRLRDTLVRWQRATGSEGRPRPRAIDDAAAAELRALGYLD